MNDDAALYSKHCQVQKLDAKCILDEYLKYINWQDNDCILEIGVGEGSVSLEVLLPMLPPNFKKFVLSDVSGNMLEFAKSKCQDTRCEFFQMDISADIPASFYQHFDHIFSFLCLQWITDEIRHQQSFKNIFDMLKPGGEILMTVVITGAIYDVCENMAKTKKWSPYMKNMREFISLFHYLENPTEKLKQFLKNVGFCIDVCKKYTRSYTHYNFPDYLEFNLSINAVFIKLIPEKERANYILDFEEEIRKHSDVTIKKTSDGKEKICHSYKSLIVCASKPHKIF